MQITKYHNLTQMNRRTTLHTKAAETAEHLARLVRCQATQQRLKTTAQRARQRAQTER